MEDKNRMYRLIHSLRKSGGVKIDTRARTIYYEYQKQEEEMKDSKIIILCSTYGFARQAEIR